MISGMTLPILSIYLFDYDPFLPYLALVIISVIATVAAYFLPYELLGKGLDLKEEEILNG
jgi:hypothetical protein